MKEAIKIVNLRPVDGYTPKMNKVKDTREKYEIELELEESPENVWADLFKDELMKNSPPGHLVNSRNDPHLNAKSITFFTSISQIEEDGKWIVKIVDSVNEQVKQENEKIEEENKKEKGAEAEDEAIIKQMRIALKKII
jgi:hypothetical protein